MDSFMINHQAALDSQREAQAIREQIGDEDDIFFNHKQQEEDFDEYHAKFIIAVWLISG